MDGVVPSNETRIETYDAHIESVGIDGYRPESRADLQETIASAVGGDMALIEVPVE